MYMCSKMCNFYGWTKIELNFWSTKIMLIWSNSFTGWSSSWHHKVQVCTQQNNEKLVLYVNLKLYLNQSSKWISLWLTLTHSETNEHVLIHTQFFVSLSAVVFVFDGAKCHIRLAPAATIYNNLNFFPLLFLFVIENTHTEKFMLYVFRNPRFMADFKLNNEIGSGKEKERQNNDKKHMIISVFW